MSLLMDALKQAEHAKRDKQSENSPPEKSAAQPTVEKSPKDFTELSLSPEEATEHTASDADLNDTVLANLDLSPMQASAASPPEPTVAPAVQKAAPELKLAAAVEPAVVPEVVAKPEPIALAEPDKATPTKPDHHNAQAAARVLAASAARHATQKRRNIIGLISLGGILVVAIGSYYYYASLAQQTPYFGMQPSADISDEIVVPGDAIGLVTDEATAQLEAIAPTQTAWNNGPPPAEPLITQDWEPAPVDPRVLRGEPVLPTADALAAYDADATAPPVSIKITRGSQPTRVSQDLQTAYADFQADRLAQAEQGYRQVLARDEHNRDARMGLAAIAVRSGSLDAARAQYRAVLQRNPKDLTAHAALTDLGQDRSAGTESQLKSLLAEQPLSAQLHFALANLYAEQRRWPYAQQAYFEAQRLAPTHPDYAFNLAVSLEHLGQPRVALEYYRRAIQLAAAHNAQFDLRAAQQRIDALSAQAQP